MDLSRRRFTKLLGGIGASAGSRPSHERNPIPRTRCGSSSAFLSAALWTSPHGLSRRRCPNSSGSRLPFRITRERVGMLQRARSSGPRQTVTTNVPASLRAAQIEGG
jgi:hypothetical protein